jgi:hypothetical protein
MPSVPSSPSSASADQMNLGQIRSLARTYLMNTSSDTNSFSWSDAELNAYANEGVFYVQQLTEFTMANGNTPVVAEQSTYMGPDDQYQFVRLTFDRENITQTNYYELDRDTFSNWRNDPEGSPQRFYMPQFNEIAVYPTPIASGTIYQFNSELGTIIEVTGDDGVTPDTNYSFSSEVGTLTGYSDTVGALNHFIVDPLYVLDPFSVDVGTLISFSTDEGNLSHTYVIQPQTLVNDTDIPQLPPQCGMALVQYVVMRAFARDGEFQDLNLAQAWFTAFSDWMSSVMDAQGKDWPTRVKSLEPYETGNVFSARLRNVGAPGFIQKFGQA